jgi:hypothetical protein
MTEPLEPGFELLAPPPRRAHGKLFASLAAVVLLGVGGAISYVAIASDRTGAATPRQAVQRVLTDLEHGDLVGVVDDLPPGERAALAGALRSDVSSLKRLGVLTHAADPAAVSGVTFAAHGLTYADQPIAVNDHVQIVQITGGTVDLGLDAADLPFTRAFLDRLDPRPSSDHRSVAITRPVRIATQKVGDTWYPSVFYTVADAAAHSVIPSSADRIPARGAGSPEQAVERLVRALGSGDLASAIAVVSPAELGALHDYGGLVVRSAERTRRPSMSITTLDLVSTPVSGGARVQLRKVVVSSDGRRLGIALDGGCASVDLGGLHRKVCPSDVPGLISMFAGGFRCDGAGGSSSGIAQGRLPDCHARPFTAAQRQAITDLVSGILSGGIDTAKAGGAWFVSPVRTLADTGSTVLGALKGNDLLELSTLGH